MTRFVHMPTYSHSQLETFLQCRLKYKFKYIDRIKVPVAKSVELFLGDVVHQTFKFLYDGVVKKTVFPKSIVLEQFDKTWDSLWTADIGIVRDKTATDYRDMGRQFLEQFYDVYFPFDQFEIVGLETNDRYVLVDGNQYYVRIDKLGKSADGTFYVCDYKTNNKLKTEDELKKDRQLAMYALWVRQKYPSAKTVKLVWYFVAHNKRFEIEHSQQDLSRIEQTTVDVIKEIAACKDFPANPGRLCDWCEYKSICPAWNPGIASDLTATNSRVIGGALSGGTISVSESRIGAAQKKKSDGGETIIGVDSGAKKKTKQQRLDFF